MTEKRFRLKVFERGAIVKIYDNNRIIFDVAYRDYADAKYLREKLTGIVERLNDLHEEVEYLKPLANENTHYIGNMEDDVITFQQRIKTLESENQELMKQLYLTHMASMFSTVKSFKGDVSKRYVYDEENDVIYDTANNYGQYNKILDKKEVTMLLNEYNTLLEDSE